MADIPNPAEFRREYGALMAQSFDDLSHNAAQQGIRAVLWLWLRTLVDLSVTALYEHWGKRKIVMRKRAFDVFFAGLGLGLMLPFMAVVALLIKLDSPGSVWFIQSRTGWGGKPFRMYKFRTQFWLLIRPPLR